VQQATLLVTKTFIKSRTITKQQYDKTLNKQKQKPSAYFTTTRKATAFQTSVIKARKRI
jgi:hypothetical protein